MVIAFAGPHAVTLPCNLQFFRTHLPVTFTSDSLSNSLQSDILRPWTLLNIYQALGLLNCQGEMWFQNQIVSVQS